jgi:hypothetical protein
MKHGHSPDCGRRRPEERKGARTIRPAGQPTPLPTISPRSGWATPGRTAAQALLHFDNGAPHRFGWGIDNAY